MINGTEVSNKILVQLKIKQWSAKVIDKPITSGAVATFGGKLGDGKFTKVLVPEETMAPISKAAGKARTIHKYYSLPWLSDGVNIITSELYSTYIEAMAGPIDEFKAAASYFCEPERYGRMVEEQRYRLKSAFDITNYPHPDSISDLFGIKIGFYPFPDAKDWRLDLAESEAELIKHNAQVEIKEALQTAVADAGARLRDCLSRFIERMAEYKEGGRLYASVLDNLIGLADILPRLNLTGSKELDLAAFEIKSRLSSFSIEDLRESPALRDQARNEALDIIRRLG